MNLAKIEHYRCGDRDHADYKTTLVWVPTDMDKPELDALIERAREDCLSAEVMVDGVKQPQYRTYWDFISKVDKSKSIAQAEAEYAEHQATYEAWTKMRDAARKSFARRLVDLSNGRVVLFWDEKCPIETECNWGHNHGKRVDYGEVDI